MKWLLQHLPQRTYAGVSGPYLTRYKLASLGKKLVRVYLNRFHRSDEDRELHSHPWKWAIVIVLKGGYVEERPMEGGNGPPFLTVNVSRKPGSIYIIRPDLFHRVDLREAESWSLFIAGPEVDGALWYFFNTYRGSVIDWRTFIARKEARQARYDERN